MAHAKAVTSFVAIDSTGQPTDTARSAILEDYHALGFALFQLDSGERNPAEVLRDFTGSLNLGEAFVPPLYQFSNSTLYDDLGMSTLAVVPGDDPNSSHPVFGSTDPLELHTDGTLQAIDEIPTSILFCVSPANRGGETTIFQAVKAFAALREDDESLASALLDSRALTKRASVNGSRAACQGPVFAFHEGVLLTRYSVSKRDHWNVEVVERLLDAKKAMAELAQAGSPYFHQLSLGARQGVILANNRVAHGRTGFFNSPEQVRRMLRVLFARQPH
jgi:Taurine catabolism dioxygenase TauD, TfdA family